MLRKLILPAVLGYLLLGALPVQAQYWGPSPALSGLGQSQAAQANQKKEPKHWKQVLKSENQRLARQSSFSVLGTDIDLDLKRLNAHSLQQWRRKDFPEERFEHNYNELKNAMLSNPLFQGYDLSAIYLVDFCDITDQNVIFLKNFFTDKQKAYEAEKYEELILITLVDENYFPFWFIINPVLRTVTFNYNDPASLEEFDSRIRSGRLPGGTQLGV